MNRTIISAILISALALTACNKDKWWPTTGAKVDLSLNIVSASPATKTFIESVDGHTYARWSAADKLLVYFDGWQDGEKPLYEMRNSSDNTDHGQFQGLAKGVLDGSHNIYAISAPSGFKGVKAERKVLFTVPEQQNPGNGSFDPAADIVVSRAYQQLVNSTDNSITINDMRFHRILATVMVGVNNTTSKDLSGEKVKKLNLESKASDVTFSGDFLWDFDSESLSAQSASPKISATLSTPISTDGEQKTYILVSPTTLTSGSSLVAIFETDHYRITKTVQVPQNVDFPANKISSLVFKLTDSDTVIENL